MRNEKKNGSRVTYGHRRTTRRAPFRFASVISAVRINYRYLYIYITSYAHNILSRGKTDGKSVLGVYDETAWETVDLQLRGGDSVLISLPVSTHKYTSGLVYVECDVSMRARFILFIRVYGRAEK